MARNECPEITEQRILGTATKLFFEKGWEETSIQDIIDKLGNLTGGVFYHHFKSTVNLLST